MYGEERKIWYDTVFVYIGNRKLRKREKQQEERPRILSFQMYRRIIKNYTENVITSH